MQLREVWWRKAASSRSSLAPPELRRSQRKDGSRRLVMGRAQPTGTSGGHYTNPWNRSICARTLPAQYCARNQPHSRVTGAGSSCGQAGHRRRADDGDPRWRVRSPAGEGKCMTSGSAAMASHAGAPGRLHRCYPRSGAYFGALDPLSDVIAGSGPSCCWSEQWPYIAGHGFGHALREGFRRHATAARAAAGSSQARGTS
jgi:hypothetical protein